MSKLIRLRRRRRLSLFSYRRHVNKIEVFTKEIPVTKKAAKIDAKNMNIPESVKNDWEPDDEDDNWDDWGDAEDNFTASEQAEAKCTENKTATTNAANANSQNEYAAKAETTTVMAKDVNSNNGAALTATQSTTTTPTTAKPSSGWGGLFGGVVSSVLSTATEGLGNITSTVSQGLNQVIGVPDPEELARINAAQQAKLRECDEKTTAEPGGGEQVWNEEQSPKSQEDEQQQSAIAPMFGLNLVSGVTTLGSKVINTGLDTLEGIGKKTMDILQENDPLLMNKRKMLGLEPDRPNLSEILHEAKKNADQLENTLKELKIEKSREQLRFELLFENHCGLVHLEALEILSKESTLKLQTLQDSVSGNALNELQETINEVKELMELEELEGESDGDYEPKQLNEQLLGAVEDVDLPITFDDIVNNWTQSLAWLTSIECSAANAQETFAKGISALAQTCALQMSKLHKIAELLLVKEHHSTANEVDSIVQLCKHFTMHLNGLTNRFASTLSDNQKQQEQDGEEAKKYVSTLFAEMLTATQHIEKAFKLFLPILQIGAV